MEIGSYNRIGSENKGLKRSIWLDIESGVYLSREIAFIELKNTKKERQSISIEEKRKSENQNRFNLIFAISVHSHVSGKYFRMTIEFVETELVLTI